MMAFGIIQTVALSICFTFFGLLSAFKWHDDDAIVAAMALLPCAVGIAGGIVLIACS